MGEGAGGLFELTRARVCIALKQMKRITFALIFIFIASACARSDGGRGLNANVDLGIIGGSAVAASDPIAASTAFIMLYNSHSKESSVCSAVLVSPDILLTAAHCFVPKSGPRRDYGYTKFVFFGTRVDIQSSAQVASAITFTEAKYTVHPNFLSTRDDFDIAVIRLPKPAPASVKPARILADSSKAANPITLAGYGLTSDTSKVPNVSMLNKMTATLSSARDSRAPESRAVTISKKQRPNHGDSGGPAFTTVGGVTYVWALDSRIAKDSKTEYYTPIAPYLAWIQQASKQLGSATSFAVPPGKSLSK